MVASLKIGIRGAEVPGRERCGDCRLGLHRLQLKQSPQAPSHTHTRWPSLFECASEVFLNGKSRAVSDIGAGDSSGGRKPDTEGWLIGPESEENDTRKNQYKIYTDPKLFTILCRELVLVHYGV